MRRRILQPVSALVGAGFTAAMIWLWPHWIFLWDGFDHRGFFLCATSERAGYTEKSCIKGDDEFVYQELTQPNGYAVRSWFSFGTEAVREMDRPGKPTLSMRRSVGRWEQHSEETEQDIAAFNAAAPALAPQRMNLDR